MRFILTLILSVIIFSCNPNVEFISYNSVNGSWHKDSVQEFGFSLSNFKTESYKTHINLRINNEYNFSNIFLIVSLRDTTNVLSRDTLQFRLADKSGKLLGNKRINLVENSLLHKEKVSLENNKKYFVTIEHAMRVINKIGGLEYLDGIVDVGYKVEKIN